MTRIFVSSCRIDGPHAAALVARLRGEAFAVLHSPRNPSDGRDGRWVDWYRRGCRAELETADIFIAVISRPWDCSTWMAHECDEALRLAEAGRLRGMFYWNPERIAVEARGMLKYLKEPLPDDLDELARALKGS